MIGINKCMDIYTIYRATNSINGKVYIGFTEHWPQRVNEHKYGHEDSKVFYKAIKKYGWDNFVWEAIYQSTDYTHTLKVMEPHFIVEHRSWVKTEDCNGYNVTRGGDGARGYKHTTDTKKRMSDMRKGVVAWNKGLTGTGPGNTTPRTEHDKQKLREANLGKKQTIETIAKRSKSLSGHIVTQETRKKISNAHTGKILSVDHIQKMRDRVVSEETKQKIREKRKLQIITEETKQKLSGCVVVINKSGELSRIPKEQYYAQMGLKDDWEWVSHKSKEAAARKLT